MKSFALIGQPNCGKSTLFNQVAGYKAETGNFSGTTVTFTESKVNIANKVVSLVDLPGTYTLAGTNPAEREVFNYLTTHDVDLIITVIDASRLSHGLEMVIEVLELQHPTIIALNMMDEANRLGIHIDIPELENKLGVPVMPIIASKGQGVKQLFNKAFIISGHNNPVKRLTYSSDLEKCIANIKTLVNDQENAFRTEAIAIKLLENDPKLSEHYQSDKKVTNTVHEFQEKIAKIRCQDANWAISGERHVIASKIANDVITHGETRVSWRDRLDKLLLHPIWGYVFLITILYLFFQSVYRVGNFLEGPLLGLFEMIEIWVYSLLGEGTLLGVLTNGLVQGVAGGAAIVLPYLVPFLLGLGLLEDIGYLPRVAFLMDTLMHKIGLHGKAIVPFILGYGCNVPAVMSTRILEEPRDRFITAALSAMVPCAARLSVVFGLVAFYIGPNFALAIYISNILVIALLAKILTSLSPQDTPGLILEIPVYRIPTFRTLSSKVWFKIKDFIIDAWPVLIIGSVLLALVSYLDLTKFFNMLVYPLSWLLGLPKEVGIPLIFGVLRKELTLVMLKQALNTTDISIAMTSVQMFTFSVFVVFYIPCLATLIALRKELGTKPMLLVTLLTLVVATICALIARGVGLLIL